ncbi:RNA polymerase sigma-I factor [Ectobacillus funiculus]|uniref:RNA polymerase sigma factor SigI n=1 Tax=Ectobacillus funiculus TaxID=137993 RepID=A0ABV5WBW2_9BACI
MLTLLLKAIKPKERIEEVVLRLQTGEGDSNAFIAQYQPFVRKVVSNVCKRYITEQDDAYSIGLFAFHQAIEKYSYKKGKSFLAFAGLLIKRDVIDYIRKELRQNLVFLKEDQQEQNLIDTQFSFSEYLNKLENETRKEEIFHFQKVLEEFRISFTDLVSVSPKHSDTREHLIEIAQTIVQDEQMLQELFQKKRLPLKQLESRVRASRKTLERHRKYIIAICIISSSDYTHIKEYVKGWMNSE